MIAEGFQGNPPMINSFNNSKTEQDLYLIKLDSNLYDEFERPKS